MIASQLRFYASPRQFLQNHPQFARYKKERTPLSQNKMKIVIVNDIIAHLNQLSIICKNMDEQITEQIESILCSQIQYFLEKTIFFKIDLIQKHLIQLLGLQQFFVLPHKKYKMNLQKFKYDGDREKTIKTICQSPKVLLDSKITRQSCIACIRYLKAESQSNQQLRINLQQLFKQSPSSIFKLFPTKNQILGSSSQVINLIEDLNIFKTRLKTIEVYLLQYSEAEFYLKKLNDLKYDKLSELQKDLINNKNLPIQIKNSLKDISNKLMQKQIVKDISSEKDLATQIQLIISKFLKYGPDSDIREINQIKSKTLRGKFVSWQRSLAFDFLYLDKQVNNNLNNFIKIMSTDSISTKQINTTFHSLPQRQKEYFEQLYCQIVRLKATAIKKQQKGYNPQINKQEEQEKEEMRKIQQFSRNQMVRQRNEAKVQMEKLQNQMEKVKKILQNIAVYPRQSNSKEVTINADNCPSIYRDSLLQILNQLKKKTLYSQQLINKEKGMVQNYLKELNQNSMLIKSLRKQNQQFQEQIQILVNEKQRSLILIQDLNIQKQWFQNQNQQLKKTSLRSKSTIFPVEGKHNLIKLQTQKNNNKNQALVTQNQRLQKIINQYEDINKEEISSRDKRSKDQKLKLQNQSLLKQNHELNDKIKSLMESDLLSEQQKKEQVQQKDRSTIELKEQIKRLKKEINEYNCESERRNQQNTQLSNKYNLLKNQNVSLMQNLTNALSNDKQKLHLHVSMIKENEKNIILQLKKMELSNRQLNSDISQLKKQKKELMKAHQILINEAISRYQKTIDQIQNNYLLVNSNLQSLQSVNDEQQQMINQMMKMGNQKGEKIVSLSIQLTKTKQQIEVVQARRKDVNVYE